MSFHWDDESDHALRDARSEGFSFSQIGERLSKLFNSNISRNAAIGRAMRIGLEKRPRVGNPNPKPRGPKRPPHMRRLTEASTPRLQRRRVTNHGNRFDYVEVNQPEPLPDMTDDLSIPQEQRKQFLDLENDHCRWPIGDVGHPDFFFCGHPTANVNAGIPYCRHHARIAGSGYGSAHRRPFRSAA